MSIVPQTVTKIPRISEVTMKPETGIGIAGALFGVVAGALFIGPPDMIMGALYGIWGGLIAVGIYKVVKRAKVVRAWCREIGRLIYLFAKVGNRHGNAE